MSEVELRIVSFVFHCAFIRQIVRTQNEIKNLLRRSQFWLIEFEEIIIGLCLAPFITSVH